KHCGLVAEPHEVCRDGRARAFISDGKLHIRRNLRTCLSSHAESRSGACEARENSAAPGQGAIVRWLPHSTLHNEQQRFYTYSAEVAALSRRLISALIDARSSCVRAARGVAMGTSTSTRAGRADKKNRRSARRTASSMSWVTMRVVSARLSTSVTSS